jgi:hypothetical protein
MKASPELHAEITDSETVRLCVEGTQAEFAGKPDQARVLYERAWTASKNDYEACIAAHYMARTQETPQDCLRWNQIALTHANVVGEERVRAFLPSLYVNLGQSYELLGNHVEA